MRYYRPAPGQIKGRGDQEPDESGPAAPHANQIDSPLSFYTYDHSVSYFYRPNAMVLWWLSVATLELNPAAHYMLNFALHVLNAMLVAAVVYEFTHRRGVAQLQLHAAPLGLVHDDF